ncbi:MAG: hypothetical protein Q9227_007085 [Pyrenula ochraceoflavens]
MPSKPSTPSSSSSLSTSPALPLIASLFGTIFLGFGVNAMLRPRSGLSFFPFSYPLDPTSHHLIDALMIVYGARDIFMGIAINVAAYLARGGEGAGKARTVLGWVLVAGSAVAGVDGAVVKAYAGDGQWNHWGYAPVLTVTGGLLLGVLG